MHQPREKSFLTHAAIYGFGSVLLQMAAIVLLPLYTWHLTRAEFGVLEMINRVGEIFNLFLLVNGIRLAAFTFYCQATSGTERDRTAATVLWAPILLLLTGGLAMTTAAGWLGHWVGIEDPRMAVLAIAMILLEGTLTVPMALVQARVESTWFIAITALMFVFRLALTVLLVAGLHWGIWGVLGASAATSATFGAALTFRELCKSTFLPDLKMMRQVLVFSLPLLPAGLCGMLIHNGDRFFLLRYRGAEEVGLYSLGYKVALAVGLLSTGPLCQVWSARMFDAFKLPNASRYVGSVCTRILAAYLFVGVGVCVMDDSLIAVLAPATYGGATSVVRPLVFAYFFWIAANLMDAPLWVCRRSDLKPWILLGSSTVTVALYVWLIPTEGAMGAAYATLGGLLVHSILTLVVSQRVFRVRYEFRRLFILFASALAIASVSDALRTGAWGLVVKLALWLGWPAALWWTGVVTRKEKEMVATAYQAVRRRIGEAVRLRFAPTRDQSPDPIPKTVRPAVQAGCEMASRKSGD